jgi:hypothetical protein
VVQEQAAGDKDKGKRGTQHPTAGFGSGCVINRGQLPAKTLGLGQPALHPDLRKHRFSLCKAFKGLFTPTLRRGQLS